jgi:hypothetical protein
VAGLFKWGARKIDVRAAPRQPVAPSPEPVRPSKVLPRFLSALAPVSSPVLLNLGPVVGQNVAFFGERLACKLFVEDLLPDPGMPPKPAALSAAVVEARLGHPPGSIDGILCWDVFDFLDRATSQRLAAHLVKLLRQGGVLYGFFGTASTPIVQATRFIVEGPENLRLRMAPVAPRPRNVLVNRDINKMFDGLVVTESVLLKSATRETLFRKP